MTLYQAKQNHPASTGRSTTIADKATAAVRNDHGSTRAVNRSRRSSRLRRSRLGVSESQTTELVVLTVEIIVWGVLLACLALVLFPMLDPRDELVLSSTLIGGIAVGGFPTMRFRGITVVWISLVGVG